MNVFDILKVAPYVGAWIETEYNTDNIINISVAPYVGAWIETASRVFKIARRFVAPYVGAWIETTNIHDIAGGDLSHPTWVRGLKPNTLYIRILFAESHPTWVRGLKPNLGAHRVGPEWSHPTWVRGLKLYLYLSSLFSSVVAPYVGAWIETLSITWYAVRHTVAPYVGAWIETFSSR